jgi:hypothetical protein
MLNTPSRSILKTGCTGVTPETVTSVSVAFSVGVAVAVQVGVAVGVRVGVAVAVSVAVGDGVGVELVAGVAVGRTGVGVDRIACMGTIPVSSIATSGNASKPNQITQRRCSCPIPALCIIDHWQAYPKRRPVSSQPPEAS